MPRISIQYIYNHPYLTWKVPTIIGC